MIRQALEGIRTELNNTLTAGAVSNEPIVRILNIAGLDTTPGNAPTDKVLMSLVNIEEETTLKNGSAYKQIDATRTVKGNPTLFLNCYILFAINSTAEQNYLNALLLLSRVINFFQHKRVFTPDNTPSLDAGIEKLIAEMCSLNFEQLNHLWAMLGGRYMPSALYRFRMLMIEDSQPEPSSIITTIDINSHRL